ncbi:VirB4 family type IV secretion system protein [Haloarcula sp. H-GB5]
MNPDEIRDKFQEFIGIKDDSSRERGGRIDIDSLSGTELQDAIDYLDAIGRDTTRDDIEEAAYYLRNVDDDVELYSAFESGTERSRVDRSIVAPSNMERDTKWHTRDGDFYQVLTATSMPRLVTPGWLVPITLSEHDIRLSMQIKPRETASVKGKLQQRLTQMKSAIQWKKRRGRTDVYEEEHERKELERLLRSVIEGTTKLFNVGFYMEVHGRTLEEMEEASRNIQRTVSEQGMDLTPIEGRQIESQQSMLPVGTDPIRNYNTVQLEALATFFNFVEPPVNQPDGVLMGFDDSKRPVIVDRFSLSGHSKVVTGKVGGGKTYSVKLALYRRLLNDPGLRIIVFDPLGDDFVDFTEKVGGTVIKFGGDDRINPLDIQPPSGGESPEDLYTTKVRSAIEILKTYFAQSSRGGMRAGEEGVITQCIHYAYSKMGITSDPETFDNKSPIIDDVIEGVRIIAQGGLESDSSPINEEMADGAGTLDLCPPRVREIMMDPSDQHVKIAQELVPKFESFKAGSVNNNLNGQTNIELDDRIVCFNMESFADTGEMPLIMHTMLDWAYQETRRSPKRTDVTFEEVHYLLGRPGARNLLNLFIRHARHFDAGLTLISQTPDEFLGHDQKKEIYDNCDIKQLFYQENVSPEVINYFDFSEEEARFLRQAARGQNSNFSECLLSTSEHGRRRLEIYAGPYERHMLEEDLDPEGYLKQQGLLENETDVGNSSHLKDAVPQTQDISEPMAPSTDPAKPSKDKPLTQIENPDDLTEANQTVRHDPEPEDSEDSGKTSTRDPFRVSGSGQAESVEVNGSETEQNAVAPEEQPNLQEHPQNNSLSGEGEDIRGTAPDDISLDDVVKEQNNISGPTKEHEEAEETDPSLIHQLLERVPIGSNGSSEDDEQ